MPLSVAPLEEGTTTDVVGGALAMVTWTPGLKPVLPTEFVATLCSVYVPLGTVVVFSWDR